MCELAFLDTVSLPIFAAMPGKRDYPLVAATRDRAIASTRPNRAG